MIKYHLQSFRDSPPTGGQEAVHQTMWFVYALYNFENNKIYIGESGNIDERIIDHNKKRGNHFTARFTGEWKLIYKEEIFDRKAALLREKQLKTYKGRQFIKQYIPR